MALIGTLSDNFDDNSLDTAKWSVVVVSGTYAGGEQNGRWEVDPDNNSRIALQSVNTYDVTGSELVLQMDLTAYGTSGEVGPYLWIDTNNWLRIVATGGNLYAQRSASGTITTVAGPVAHSDTNHAWLRFRESAGTFYFDAAPDSTGSPGTWTALGSFSTSAYAPGITAMYARLDVNFSTTGTSGTAAFDNVNPSAAPAATSKPYYHRLSALGGLGSGL